MANPYLLFLMLSTYPIIWGLWKLYKSVQQKKQEREDEEEGICVQGLRDAETEQADKPLE